MLPYRINKMKNSVIGGEYYHSPFVLLKPKMLDLREYLKSKYPNKYYYFTGGGYSSITTIIEDVGFENGTEILLPSYLCASMLLPFKNKCVKYGFYKVGIDLEIDLDDLSHRIGRNTKAVLFINYFGFPPKQDVLDLLKKLKEDGVVLIEDGVQSFFSNIDPVGDYFFNSFRKYFPIDGSVIISNKPIRGAGRRVLNSKYLLLKSFGQILRMLTIRLPLLDFSRVFLKLFKSADDAYYKHSNVRFSGLNKYLLSKYCLSCITKKRRENYIQMLTKYHKAALFKKLGSEVVPFGFPICVKNRDTFRTKLMEKNIFCPIHWVLPNEIDKEEFSESWELSKTILTFPLSENVSGNDLDYLEKNMEGLYGDLS